MAAKADWKVSKPPNGITGSVPTTSTPTKTGGVKSTELETVATVEIPTNHRTTFDTTTKARDHADAGERADVAHTAPTSMGWDVATGPLKLTGAADAQAVAQAAQRAVDLVSMAVGDVEAGRNGGATYASALKLTDELWAAVSAFAQQNPLLKPADQSAVKGLIDALTKTLPLADAAQKQLAAANIDSLIAQGYRKVDDAELKESWNEQVIAKGLAPLATTQPLFAVLSGRPVTMQPGDATNVDARVKTAIETYRSLPGDASSNLYSARSALARRVEVTEAQSRPVRSNDEIAQASLAYAKQNGYAATSLAASVGGAMQELANHEEIGQFAGRVLMLSLEEVDPKQYPDRATRVGRALEQAKYWVGNYGRNERDLDAVWLSALEQCAKTAALVF